MADRWPHRVVGLLYYGCALYASYLTTGGEMSDIPWMAMGFGVSMFGAELPDYDDYKRFRSWRTHRSFLTHSPLLPTALLGLIWLLAPASALGIMCPFVAFLLLGHASHLLLDIAPSIETKKPDEKIEETKIKKENSSGKKEYKRKNKYSIHFPGFTASKPQTIVLLFVFYVFEIFLSLWALGAIPWFPFR